MRVVLCGDMLFSSRNLAKRLSPEIVKILKEADAVFCNAEFSTPKRGTPPGLCMYLTSVPQEIQDEFPQMVNDRMSRVVSALITAYNVLILA